MGKISRENGNKKMTGIPGKRDPGREALVITFKKNRFKKKVPEVVRFLEIRKLKKKLPIHISKAWYVLTRMTQYD